MKKIKVVYTGERCSSDNKLVNSFLEMKGNKITDRELLFKKVRKRNFYIGYTYEITEVGDGQFQLDAVAVGSVEYTEKEAEWRKLDLAARQVKSDRELKSKTNSMKLIEKDLAFLDKYLQGLSEEECEGLIKVVIRQLYLKRLKKRG